MPQRATAKRDSPIRRFYIEYYRRNNAGDLTLQRGVHSDRLPRRLECKPPSIEFRVYTLIQTENWES